MDQSDLHDYEVKQISLIWAALQRDWSHRPNTRAVLQEFAKVANDTFLKAGFVVNVQWENTLIMVPKADGSIAPMPITIEVLGRVNPVDEFDHERKRYEVLTANERGEKYLGEKESRVIK